MWQASRCKLSVAISYLFVIALTTTITTLVSDSSLLISNLTFAQIPSDRCLT
jgi:hypothetical protein